MFEASEYLAKTSFSHNQIEAIKRDLNISCRQDLDRKIDHINGACSYYKFIKTNRAGIPDLRAARDNLSDILHHAKALRTALGIAPLAQYFTGFEAHENLVEIEQAETVGSQLLLLKNTTVLLSGIIAQAEKLAINDEIIRKYYLLPEGSKKNNNLETICLWPSLFDIYSEARKGITFSPDGPLVRYIATIHEALGIERPSSSTIRTAVPTWKAARRAIVGSDGPC